MLWLEVSHFDKPGGPLYHHGWILVPRCVCSCREKVSYSVPRCAIKCLILSFTTPTSVNAIMARQTSFRSRGMASACQ